MIPSRIRPRGEYSIVTITAREADLVEIFQHGKRIFSTRANLIAQRLNIDATVL